ncbi:MAG TPA: AAA family ATPase [Acidimicrobiales bacterium]|nr:AAA family ATPase [Acidimicrobiales bacterium]HVB93094.1 AAA family ATPase [Acidimicrobiales bacterium]
MEPSRGALGARTQVATDLRERDGAAGEITAALDSAPGGDGRVVFLVGEAGTGKTALLAAARQMANLA